MATFLVPSAYMKVCTTSLIPQWRCQLRRFYDLQILLDHAVCLTDLKSDSVSDRFPVCFDTGAANRAGNRELAIEDGEECPTVTDIRYRKAKYK